MVIDWSLLVALSLAETFTIPSMNNSQVNSYFMKVTTWRTSVDVEGDLNLRDTLGCGRNAMEVEIAEEFVVPYELTLTLVNLDFDRGLAISSC